MCRRIAWPRVRIEMAIAATYEQPAERRLQRSEKLGDASSK